MTIILIFFSLQVSIDLLLNSLFIVPCPSKIHSSYPEDRFRQRDLLIEMYQNFITNRKSSCSKPGYYSFWFILDSSDKLSLFVVSHITYLYIWIFNRWLRFDNCHLTIPSCHVMCNPCMFCCFKDS